TLPYTRGNRNGRIVFVGEAPGADEEIAYTAGRSATAFVGSSGNELDSMCCDSNIDIDDCYYTNVAKQRPPDNEIKVFTRQEIVDWIDILHKELASLPNVNVIVPVGNLALQAVAGIKTITWMKKEPDKMKGLAGIGTWRGSILSSLPLGENNRVIKVIPTYHPAFVQRQWSYRVTVIADLERIAEDSKFPELRLPEHNIIIEPDKSTTLEAIAECKRAERIATDIENLRKFIFCFGLAWTNNDAICIPMFWPDGENYWSPEDEAEILFALADLLSNHKGQVGQFYYHDCYYYHHYGLIEALKRRFNGCLWDTFSQHVCLYGELPHTLAYLCSMYTRVPYYKAEGRNWMQKDKRKGIEQFWRYNGKDCIVTREISFPLEIELAEFGRLEFYDTYYRRLFPHLLQSGLRGIAIDETIRSQARIEYKQRWTDMQTQLQIIAKKPMDLHPGDPYDKWKGDEQYVNVAAHKKLRLWFNETLGVPLKSTDEKNLKEARGLYPEAAGTINLILDIKEVRKEKETYLDPKLGHDTRFHFILKASTETGRLASQKDPMGY
ncbi:MAG: uracil-DNA glycosylase family protein, partial [Nitrosopumilus sp.]